MQFHLFSNVLKFAKRELLVGAGGCQVADEFVDLLADHADFVSPLELASVET